MLDRRRYFPNVFCKAHVTISSYAEDIQLSNLTIMALIIEESRIIYFTILVGLRLAQRLAQNLTIRMGCRVHAPLQDPEIAAMGARVSGLSSELSPGRAQPHPADEIISSSSDTETNISTYSVCSNFFRCEDHNPANRPNHISYLQHARQSRKKTMSTSSGAGESWISSFCSLLGHEYFAEVSEEFIEDDFNLTGLQSQVPMYKEALEVRLSYAFTCCYAYIPTDDLGC